MVWQAIAGAVLKEGSKGGAGALAPVVSGGGDLDFGFCGFFGVDFFDSLTILNKMKWRVDVSPVVISQCELGEIYLVVRKSLGDQVAWFREGYDGAQDYDLILRLVEKARG